MAQKAMVVRWVRRIAYVSVVQVPDDTQVDPERRARMLIHAAPMQYAEDATVLADDSVVESVTEVK